MTIRCLHFVTQQTWMDTQFSCAEVGLTAALFRYQKPRVVFKPTLPLQQTPVRCVFIQEEGERLLSPTLLNKVAKADLEYICIVKVSPSQALELGVKSTERWKTVREDILKPSRKVSIPFKQRDLIQEVLDFNTRESVLQRVHPAFYRVKNKEDRLATQNKVYRYLAGISKRQPKTGIKLIDEMLSSDLCRRFRLAVQESLTKDIDETAARYDIDRFEIAFVRSKTSL